MVAHRFEGLESEAFAVEVYAGRGHDDSDGSHVFVFPGEA